MSYDEKAEARKIVEAIVLPIASLFLIGWILYHAYLWDNPEFILPAVPIIIPFVTLFISHVKKRIHKRRN